MQQGNRQLLKSLVQKVVGSLGALMVLVSFAHATPIVDLNATDIHVSTMVASPLHTAAPAAASSARNNNFYTLGMATWPASSSTCTLSGDCRATTKIPEPQSLMLVGSGLLSTAGFIRRRLTR
jgi:hypothetical protein